MFAGTLHDFTGLLAAAASKGSPRGGHLSVADVDKYDFPALATRCLTELGLISTDPPKSEGEKHLRKIASSAKTMIETANALRNLAGTGHGRVVGASEVVTSADASLVASSGLILAAWMLRHDASLP